MATQNQVIKVLSEVKECPHCHLHPTLWERLMKLLGRRVVRKTFTVGELAMADDVAAGKLSPDQPVGVEHIVIPLEQPALAVTSVRSIHCCIDYCAECGTRYCTRAELVRLPVSIQTMPGPGQKRGRGGFPFTQG